MDSICKLITIDYFKCYISQLFYHLQVAMIAYFTLFIASISTAGFSNIMVSPQQGIPLFAFFPIKSFFSAVIFFAFVADTGLSI